MDQTQTHNVEWYKSTPTGTHNVKSFAAFEGPRNNNIFSSRLCTHAHTQSINLKPHTGDDLHKPLRMEERKMTFCMSHWLSCREMEEWVPEASKNLLDLGVETLLGHVHFWFEGLPPPLNFFLNWQTKWLNAKPPPRVQPSSSSWYLLAIFCRKF